VAFAEQRHQREADLFVLAHDDALDVGDDLFAGFLDGHRRPSSPAVLSAVSPARSPMVRQTVQAVVSAA
jgi:hypothetical protein